MLLEEKEVQRFDEKLSAGWFAKMSFFLSRETDENGLNEGWS